MVGQHQGDAGGELLGVLEMEELVRSVGVGVRPEDAGDEELSAREALTQHAHEGDGAAASHMNGLVSVDLA